MKRIYYITKDKATFKADVDKMFHRGKPLPEPGTQFVYVEGPETLTGLTDPRAVLFGTDWVLRPDRQELINRLAQRMKVHERITDLAA